MARVPIGYFGHRGLYAKVDIYIIVETSPEGTCWSNSPNGYPDNFNPERIHVSVFGFMGLRTHGELEYVPSRGFWRTCGHLADSVGTFWHHTPKQLLRNMMIFCWLRHMQMLAVDFGILPPPSPKSVVLEVVPPNLNQSEARPIHE